MSNVNVCCSPIVIPGPPGGQGGSGTNGTNGKSAFTTLTGTITMPAELATFVPDVPVVDSSWATPDLVVFISNLGFFRIVAIPSLTSLTLRNLKDTPNAAYMVNAAPGTITGAGSYVVPAGIQGPSGSTVWSAAGDIELDGGGLPRLAITTTKGDLIVNNNAAVAPRNTRLAMGTPGYILHARAAGTMPAYGKLDLAGTNTIIENQVPLANGGTAYNAATVAALIKHLLPLTTKGDLVVYDNTGAINRFGVPADGLILTADSTQATGWRGTAPATGSTFTRSAAAVSPYDVPLASSLIGVTALPMTLRFAAGAGYGSKIITVKDELGTAGVNNITLQSLVGENFEGAGTYVISINRGVVRLYWSGLEWKIA